MAFSHVGIELEFSGSGVEEVAKIAKCNKSEYQLEEGKIVVRIDERYFRPTEVDLLLGDNNRAIKKLKWKPEHDLQSLVEDMMLSDLESTRKDHLLKKHGYAVHSEIES